MKDWKLTDTVMSFSELQNSEFDKVWKYLQPKIEQACKDQGLEKALEPGTVASETLVDVTSPTIIDDIQDSKSEEEAIEGFLENLKCHLEGKVAN